MRKTKNLKIKIFSQIALISSINCGCLFFTSCSNRSPYIKQTNDPEALTQKATLVNGNAKVLYIGFSLNNAKDIPLEKIQINCDGFANYANECKGGLQTKFVNIEHVSDSVVNFDIEVTFSNILPNENSIKTEFNFFYENTKIQTDSHTYSLLFSGSKATDEVKMPETKSFSAVLRSTCFTTIINGFSYIGLKDDFKKLQANIVSEDNQGIFDYKIIDVDESKNQFNLQINGYDLFNITEEWPLKLKITFNVGDRIIKCDENEIGGVLTPSTEFANFIDDDWSTIGYYAKTSGFVGLQKRYGLKSFVGLAKKIVINGIEHKVRVVAEENEVLYNTTTKEGSRAALTFMFVDAVTEKNSITSAFSPIKKQWDDSNNIWEFQGEKSSINEWLNTDFLKLLPSDLSTLIPTVRKSTLLQTTCSNVDSWQKVWLPSLSEVGGDISTENNVFALEGQCYKYFDNINTNNFWEKRKIKCVNGVSPEHCWLRTPSLTCADTVYGIYGGAILPYRLNFNVTNSNCIAPCFCI